jgi:hypothetical protein
MQAVEALSQMGGVARWHELQSSGVSARELRRATAAGHVIAPDRGTYALRHVPQAHVAAVALRGQVTCLTACAELKLRQLHPPEAIHIGIPANRHLKPRRLERLGLSDVHRGVMWVPGQRVVSIRDALDTSAMCATPLQQLVMLDAALEAGLIQHPELMFFRCGDAKRREWLRMNANGGAMSVSETVARAALVAAGLKPRVQVGRPGVGTLDLAVGKRFFIEVDGFEEHSKWGQFSKDRRRDREVSAARDWTLRYTYWDVVEDPMWFVHDVARIVRIPLHTRFEARMAWLMAKPATALNRI